MSFELTGPPERIGSVAQGLSRGSLVIVCSTISPVTTVQLAARLAAQGVGWVDAPVSGGSEGARTATLSIMVGGADDDVMRATPVLAATGSTLTRLGPVEAGQWTTAINQVILAGAYLAVAEGVTLGLQAGLDMERSLRHCGAEPRVRGSCRTVANG
jgi:3-hydroxyisobutyrate dehydrogenase-like beta-hydroxyacid dehydrogenase